MAEWGRRRGPDFIRLCRRRARMNGDGWRGAARLGGGNIERNRLETEKKKKGVRRLREGGGERAKDGGAKRK